MDIAWVTYRNTALRLTLVGEQGPPVVFVHGIGLHAGAYRSLVPGVDFLEALAGQGLRVLALDLQGHGRSEGARGRLPFRDALGNIAEAVAFAATLGDRVGLAGSGLGGMLAFYAGLEDDRVAAVAAHTVADLRSVGSFEMRLRARAMASLAGRARGIASRIGGLPVPVAALVSPNDMFEDPANARRWRRGRGIVRAYTLESLVSLFLTPDDKPAVESMTKPLLVLAGEEDRITPLQAQQDVVSRVPGSELFVLGGAGHMLPLEHCRATAERMGQWLRPGLSPRGRGSRRAAAAPRARPARGGTRTTPRSGGARRSRPQEPT